MCGVGGKEPKPAGTLILDSLTPKLGENTSLLFKGPCLIMVALAN